MDRVSDAWGCSSLSPAPPPPVWLTLPMIACPPRLTVTCSTVTFCSPAGAVSFQCLDLHRKGARQLVECAFGTVLLWNILHMRKPARERHRCHMDCGHLGCQHGFHLVPRRNPLHGRKHEIKAALVQLRALASCVGQLAEKSVEEGAIGRAESRHEKNIPHVRVRMIRQDARRPSLWSTLMRGAGIFAVRRAFRSSSAWRSAGFIS